MLFALGVQEKVSGADGVGRDLFHFGEQGVVEVVVAGFVVGVEVLLEVSVGEFVAFLEFAVGFVVFLDGVVGEVDLRVTVVLCRELVRGGTQVTLLIPVPLEIPIHTGNQKIVPDIELPPIIQQRLLNILLQYKSPITPIPILLPPPEPQLNIIQTRTHTDPRPSIRKLPRLRNPNIPHTLIPLLLLLKPIIYLQKPLILRVLHPLGGDMEGDRENSEYVFFFELVVFSHGIEEGLFVADEGVGEEMVGDDEGVGRVDFGGAFVLEEPGTFDVGFVLEGELGFVVFLEVDFPEEELGGVEDFGVGVFGLGEERFLVLGRGDWGELSAAG